MAKKKKITITIDPEILQTIDRIINENKDYIQIITSSKREGGRSTIINMVLNAIFIPSHQIDEIFYLDKMSHKNISSTLRQLIDNSINLQIERMKKK